MKRRFTVKPKMIKASTIMCAKHPIAERVEQWIRDNVDDSNRGIEPPYVGAFIDGDVFAWTVDEVAYTGTISSCIEAAESVLLEGIGDEDAMWDSLFYKGTIKTLYELSDIVHLFREHGKELPDWYFD